MQKNDKVKFKRIDMHTISFDSEFKKWQPTCMYLCHVNILWSASFRQTFPNCQNEETSLPGTWLSTYALHIQIENNTKSKFVQPITDGFSVDLIGMVWLCMILSCVSGIGTRCVSILINFLKKLHVDNYIYLHGNWVSSNSVFL